MTRKNLYYNARQKIVQPKKRPNRGFILGAVFVLLASLYTGLALTKAVPPIYAEVTLLEQPAVTADEIQWPDQGQAAIGSTQDGILATSAGGGNMKPIASITKTITALAVLDKQPIELGEQYPVYTITRQDVQIYNNYVAKFGSVMPVGVGQELTQYQMLQALMLPSANNIADTLVVWVFGSMEAYVQYANEYIKSIGLEHTVIADASGFSPQSMSTPEDLIRIGQKVLNHPVLADIAAQTQTVVPGTGIIRNTNLLLQDENMVGIKTGTTDEAGSCLLFAVKHGPDQSEVLIGVVMGQPNWPETYRAARLLRDSALDNFDYIEVMPESATVGRYTAPWGVTASAKPSAPVLVYGWKGKPPKVSVQLHAIEAPQKAGNKAGVITIADSGQEVSVQLEQLIDPPSIWWRLTNYW